MNVSLVTIPVFASQCRHSVVYSIDGKNSAGKFPVPMEKLPDDYSKVIPFEPVCRGNVAAYRVNTTRLTTIRIAADGFHFGFARLV